MHAFDHHEAWEMKPRKLSIDEVEHPERVIDEFFQFAQIPQVRWYLWELMKTMVSGNFNQLKTRERANMIFFYEQLEKLIEGVNVLHAQQGRQQ